MKLVRGESLEAAVRAFASLDALLGVVERVCDAVAFAHAHGVIHRDLTPRNVMAGAFGEVLVMDWGVAKVRGVVESSRAERPGDATAGAAREPTTAHGTVLGTPGFMAPEQAAGDVDLVDARSDVYALGALLRWMLGEWRGSAPGRTVPRALAAIAAHATAPDPERRYATVPDLARDVAAFRAGDRVLAHREGLLERSARIFARYRTPILLVAAYLVMRVALLLWGGR
jgi:serine/threonine protein kinase